MFEVLVVEAVAHEVSQIRNDSFGTFMFQKLSQMIVGSRKEFYQDLTSDTDFRFLLVLIDRQTVKIVDDRTADLFEPGMAQMFAGYKIDTDFFPFSM